MTPLTPAQSWELLAYGAFLLATIIMATSVMTVVAHRKIVVASELDPARREIERLQAAEALAHILWWDRERLLLDDDQPRP